MLAMIWHEIVCWFLKIYPLLTVLAWLGTYNCFAHLKVMTKKQFCVSVPQTFSNLGKFSEINKQFHVKSWLTYRSFSSVWWILSCTDWCTGLLLKTIYQDFFLWAKQFHRISRRKSCNIWIYNHSLMSGWRFQTRSLFMKW